MLHLALSIKTLMKLVVMVKHYTKLLPPPPKLLLIKTFTFHDNVVICIGSVRTGFLFYLNIIGKIKCLPLPCYKFHLIRQDRPSNKNMFYVLHAEVMPTASFRNLIWYLLYGLGNSALEVEKDATS